MPDELVIVATFGVPAEAELARQRLLDAGIQAVLDGDVTANTLSYIGTALGGVKLMVRAPERESAERVLRSVQHTDDDAVADRTDAWICPNCSADVGADFDVCWRCGSTRDGA